MPGRAADGLEQSIGKRRQPRASRAEKNGNPVQTLLHYGPLRILRGGPLLPARRVARGAVLPVIEDDSGADGGSVGNGGGDGGADGLAANSG